MIAGARRAGVLAALLGASLVAGLAPACVGTRTPRTQTFEVDAAGEAFTLTIAEAGPRSLRIQGDARGAPLRVSGGAGPGEARGQGSPEDARRALLEYLDAHIDRLADVPEAAADLDRMRKFRRAYATAPRAGRAR